VKAVLVQQENRDVCTETKKEAKMTQNNKISYDTIRKNKTLNKFFETRKEDENESD
jgi:hypothetical protein